MTKGKTLIDTRIANGIAIVVTLVWATAFIADIISDKYAAPVGIHAAFMTVIGSIFGYQLVAGKDK